MTRRGWVAEERRPEITRAERAWRSALARIDRPGEPGAADRLAEERAFARYHEMKAETGACLAVGCWRIVSESDYCPRHA